MECQNCGKLGEYPYCNDTCADAHRDLYYRVPVTDTTNQTND